MRSGHGSAQSWCRQYVAFSFALLSSATMTILLRRELQSLPYDPIDIFALKFIPVSKL